MKIWHITVLVTNVLIMGIVTILFIQSKTNDVMASIQATSMENEKAIDQRLKTLEATLLNSTNTATSTTTDILGLRIQELNSATASRITSTSSDASTKLFHRLDMLEKLMNDKFAALLKDVDAGKLKTLEGKWEATLPSGAKRQASIEQLNDVRYKLSKFGVFSGIYKLKDNRLVVVEPVDKRLTEFVWKVQDANNLILIESPTVTGSDYSGTTLKRIQ